MKLRSLLLYAAIICILIFTALWLMLAFTIKNKIYNHIFLKPKGVVFLCKENKINVNGFPFTINFTFIEPNICLSSVKKCIDFSNIKIKTDLLIKNVNITAHPLLKEKNINNKEKYFDIKVKFNNSLMFSVFKKEEDSNDEINSRYPLEKKIEKIFLNYSNKEKKDSHAFSFYATKKTIGKNLKGWQLYLNGRDSTNIVNIDLEGSFKKINNFYIDLQTFKYQSSSENYSIDMQGIMAVYSKKNNIKLLIDILNIDNFLNDFIKKLNLLSQENIHFISMPDEKIINFYKQKIIKEAKQEGDRSILEIHSDKNIIFIGNRSMGELLQEATDDYIKTLPKK